MFSCFSRDDKDQQIQARRKLKNQRGHIRSLMKDNKQVTFRKTSKIQENIFGQKLTEKANSIKIIILKSTEVSNKEVNIQQSHIQKFTNSKETLKVQQSQVKQVRLSELSQHKEDYSQSQIINSITSFGMIFQESHSHTKQQIEKIVSQLTNLNPFHPKIHQNTLKGFQKTNKDFDEDQPNVEQISNSQSLKKQNRLKQKRQAINQNFSKCMINRNYNDAYEAFKLMSPIEKNGFDSQGFSPLYLATLLSLCQKKQALETLKKILKDPGVKPHQKGHLNSKPIQQAILFKSIPTLTHLFRACYINRNTEIRKSLKQIVKALQQLPDLEIQLYVKVGSFVPLVDKFTPDDTIRIYKKGTNLRIDYTLVGYTFLQSKRRAMSCCIQQLDNGQYTIIGVNHDKRCYTDLLQPLEDEELVLIIQDLLNTEIKRINPQIVKTSISKDLNIFNQVIREYISTGMAIKHEVSVTYNSQTQKLRPNSLDIKKDLAFLDNWESYQSYKANEAIKKKQKQFKLGVWTCQQFPLNLDQLLEIIKFLSYAHESGQIIFNFLSNKKLKELFKGFPVKIQIPINYSLFLDIKIAQIKIQSPKVTFQFTKQFTKLKRSEYQKTIIRREKRLALIKLYT